LITTAAGDDALALVHALAPRVATPIGDPGLVEVTEVGIDPAGVYLIAPFVDAPTLESRLRGGRQSLSQVLEWLVGPARALAAAHEQQRLHGALHPRDVLLPRGRGALTGLDISPALEAVGLQAPVRVPFTAPERASGKTWDARADLYSLAMLALDALSGRRLIAGTIPAFDRWTLADTPGEDARLHEVFARALHPDPAQRFASVAEWLEALTGAAEPSSELSRFTREGVIPSAPDVRRTPPPDDVQDAKSLALFPEEETPVVGPAGAAVPPDHDAAAASPEHSVSPTGEWLVASMADDAPPLADTGPLPIQSLSSAEEDTIAAPAQSRAVEADEVDFSLRDVTDVSFDGDVAVLPAEEPVWVAPADDEQDEPARRPWIWVAGVLVIVALLAVGTWRSLIRPDVTPASDAAAAGSGEGTAMGQGPPSSDAAAGTSPNGQPSTPSVVAEESLTPSEEDVRPGAPPPERVPDTVAQQAGAGPSASAPATKAGATSASAAPRTETEPPLSLDRARVLIRSSPSGQVRVNGRPRGQTPLVLRDLPFGSYMIVITREGYVDAVREIDVLPSQPVASISVDLARQSAAGGAAPTSSGAVASAPDRRTAPSGGPVGPGSPTAPSPAPGGAAGTAPASTGSLYIVSRPTDARLFIDGQAYGTAPAVVPGLRGGQHLVRVELPGYRPWEQRVDVQPGQRVRVDATLVPEPR
jgi:hypothetical protein